MGKLIRRSDTIILGGILADIYLTCLQHSKNSKTKTLERLYCALIGQV